MEEVVTTNEKGGKQHHTGTRAQALFPNALIELSKLRYQAKFDMGYEDDNYLKIEKEEHIGRALNHIFTFLALKGDAKEELTHAACRILMALEEVILEYTEESSDDDLPEEAFGDGACEKCAYSDCDEYSPPCINCKYGISQMSNEYENAKLLWRPRK